MPGHTHTHTHIYIYIYILDILKIKDLKTTNRDRKKQINKI